MMNREINRNEILCRLNISLRKFKRSTIYALLRSHEIRVTREDVRYPCERVEEAFRIRGMKF